MFRVRDLVNCCCSCSRRASWDPKRRAGAGESSSSRRAPAGRKRHVRRGRMRAPMGASATAVAHRDDRCISGQAAHPRVFIHLCRPAGSAADDLSRNVGCGPPPPRCLSPPAGAARIERLRITRAHGAAHLSLRPLAAVLEGCESPPARRPWLFAWHGCCAELPKGNPRARP